MKNAAQTGGILYVNSSQSNFSVINSTNFSSMVGSGRIFCLIHEPMKIGKNMIAKR